MAKPVLLLYTVGNQKEVFSVSKLTKGEKKEFYKIIFPSMIEILFLQCFSFADSMMVGHMPHSTTAVAALSLCNAPINLTGHRKKYVNRRQGDK